MFDDGHESNSVDGRQRIDYHHPESKQKGETLAGVTSLLTVQEVCGLLKVPKSYIYSLTHQKRIPYLKIGGHLRFRQQDIDAWLEKQEIR